MKSPVYDLRKEFSLVTASWNIYAPTLRIEEVLPNGRKLHARILLNRPAIAMLLDELERLDRMLKRAEDGPSDEETWGQAERIAARKEAERRELRDAGRRAT